MNKILLLLLTLLVTLTSITTCNNAPNEEAFAKLVTNIEAGDNEAVTTFFESYKPPIDFGSAKVIHAAIKAQQSEVLQLLLENGASPNEIIDGTPALHAALAVRDKDMVNLLLKHNADVNIQDQDGNTVLHRTALRTSSAFANLFVEAGADTTILNNNDETALELLLANKIFYRELLLKAVDATPKGSEKQVADVVAQHLLQGEFTNGELLGNKEFVERIYRLDSKNINVKALKALLLLSEAAGGSVKDSLKEEYIDQAMLLVNDLLELGVTPKSLNVQLGRRVFARARHYADDLMNTKLYKQLYVFGNRNSLKKELTEALLAGDLAKVRGVYELQNDPALAVRELISKDDMLAYENFMARSIPYERVQLELEIPEGLEMYSVGWLTADKIYYLCSPPDSIGPVTTSVYNLADNTTEQLDIALNAASWLFNNGDIALRRADSLEIYDPITNSIKHNIPLPESYYVANGSHDGTRLVYAMEDATYIATLELSNPILLMNHEWAGKEHTVAGRVVWSKDDEQVAYTQRVLVANSGVSWTEGICVVNSDGSNPRFFKHKNAGDPSWLIDNRRLIFSETHNDEWEGKRRWSKMFILDTKTGEEQLIGEGLYEIATNPHKDLVVISKDVGIEYALHLYNVGTDTITPLTKTIAGQSVDWSPDGTMLLIDSWKRYSSVGEIVHHKVELIKLEASVEE